MPEDANKAICSLVILSEFQANCSLVKVLVAENLTCFLQFNHLWQSWVRHKFADAIKFYFYYFFM